MLVVIEAPALFPSEVGASGQGLGHSHNPPKASKKPELRNIASTIFRIPI